MREASDGSNPLERTREFPRGLYGVILQGLFMSRTYIWVKEMIAIHYNEINWRSSGNLAKEKKAVKALREISKELGFKDDLR